MQRIGFRMRIKPGCEAIYKEKHDQIWPEMIEYLRDQGITTYTIFRDGLDLFAYMETSSPTDPDAPVDPVLQRWWKMMEPYMEYEADHRPRVWGMTEVFHFE